MASISLVSGFIHEPGWLGDSRKRVDNRAAENTEIPANMPTADIPTDIDPTDTDRQLVQSGTSKAGKSQTETKAQLLSPMSI